MGIRVKNFFSSTKNFFMVLVFLLFFPLFFHGPRFGMPRIKGGDEPHYLVMINSLLNDGDLDLRNNYDSANRGSFQAGNKFMGLSLDRHAVLIIHGRPFRWDQVYEAAGNSEKWVKDKEGHPIPILKSGAPLNAPTLPQYPLHPVGIVFLLAPFLWPAKGTAYVEPLALLLANMAVIFSVFLFRKVIGRYTKDGALINLATFLAFIGTPLWAYSRTLFTEPFLVFFALGAYWMGVGKNSGLWSGILIGLGLLVKPPFAVLACPVAFLWLFRKDWGNFLRFALGPTFFVALFFYFNLKMYGLPFNTSYAYGFVNPLYGFFGLWFSWNHGILTFAPLIFPILFSWKIFLKDWGLEAVVWGMGFLIYFLVMTSTLSWSGAWSYGPREVVPVLPFLMIPACYTLSNFSDWGRLKQWGFIVLCLLSIAFNALGAMDGYWNSHPLMILRGEIS